jgi:hypothetical protein
MLDQVPDNIWEIPGDWRAAFAEVTRAARGRIVIHPNRMVVTSPLSDAEVEIETPIDAPSEWDVDRLEEVLRDATNIQLSPTRGFWTGRNIKGIVAPYSAS